jgi:hypothetical protein
MGKCGRKLSFQSNGHVCTRKPSTLNTPWPSMTAVDGQWAFSDGPDVLNDAIESIPPIRFSFFAQHLVVLPLIRAAGESSPSIRFLFVGRNGTQPSLNLGDISTLPLPCNTTGNPTFLSSGVQVPDCHTFLLQCWCATLSSRSYSLL